MSTIQGIVAEVLRVAPAEITGESSMATTAEWDSLRHMELIFRIEAEFGLLLEGDEIAVMNSVAGIETILRGKGVAIGS